MKKLSILLIGLLLVTGLAFADFGDVDVSGSASVTFGVDLNTNYTGFANAASSSVTITLIDEGDGTTGGDDGLYGEITLEDWELTLSPGDDVVQGSNGTVTAKIIVDPATITIYSAPSFSMDEAAVIDSGTVEGDIKTSLANINGTSINGITISVPAGPATVAVKVASDGDWTENADNEYVVGSHIDLAIAPLDIDLGVMYGWFGVAVLGASLGVEVDVAPATIDIGFDLSDASGDIDFDIAAGVDVDLTEENADGDAGMVGVDVYFYPDTTADLDVALSVSEPEAGGFADMLYATVAFELLDVLETLAWNVDVDGGYDTGDIDPYFGFGYGSDEVFDLNVGVVLKAGLTGIDNTAITLDYVSTDLSTDNGIITAEVEVSY
jgi:hypothetical protein